MVVKLVGTSCGLGLVSYSNDLNLYYVRRRALAPARVYMHPGGQLWQLSSSCLGASQSQVHVHIYKLYYHSAAGAQ